MNMLIFYKKKNGYGKIAFISYALYHHGHKKKDGFPKQNYLSTYKHNHSKLCDWDLTG